MHHGHLETLKEFAKKRNYGRGEAHAAQVTKLALRIYDELVRLKLLTDESEDRVILEAGALLHDIGLPQEPHHEVGFDILANEIPRLTADDPISNVALSTLLTTVLWHDERNFIKRGSVEILDHKRSEKIASIIRIADALDMVTQPAIANISLILENQQLRFIVESRHSASLQIEKAKTKSDLMMKVFGFKAIIFEHSPRHRTPL